MKTLTPLLICLLATTACCFAEPSEPDVLTRDQATRYKAEMVKALAGLGVNVREVKPRSSVLYVRYENANDQESPAFIVSAVLRLAVPLAGGSDYLSASSYRSGRMLFQVTVAPEDVPAVFSNELNEADVARLQQLAATVLAAAALGN